MKYKWKCVCENTKTGVRRIASTNNKKCCHILSSTIEECVDNVEGLHSKTRPQDRLLISRRSCILTTGQRLQGCSISQAQFLFLLAKQVKTNTCSKHCCKQRKPAYEQELCVGFMGTKEARFWRKKTFHSNCWLSQSMTDMFRKQFIVTNQKEHQWMWWGNQ